MKSIATEAVVLRRTPFGESDLLVGLFTRDLGVLTTIAKGARRSRKRFGGILDTLARLNVLIETRRANAIPLLAGASLVDFGLGLRSSLDRVAIAYYMGELVWRGTKPGVRLIELYEAFVQALDRVASDGPMPRTLAEFLLRYQQALGYRPKLDACALCHAPLAVAAEVAISYRAGGVLCPACVPSAEVNLRLPGRAVRSLVEIRAQGDRRPTDHALEDWSAAADWPALRHFLHRFTQYHLDVQPASWRWWQRLIDA
ncbi:MAG: DNA repair protein RecO [Nitrospirae bacterium]|nr:DNA repair protein RecO [Nitrospirota bacterium]